MCKTKRQEESFSSEAIAYKRNVLEYTCLKIHEIQGLVTMKELKPKHSSPVMERGKSAQRSREMRDCAWLTFHMQNKDENYAIVKFFCEDMNDINACKGISGWHPINISCYYYPFFSKMCF